MKRLLIVLVLVVVGSLATLYHPAVIAVQPITYDELTSFLAKDDVNNRTGNPLTYNCVNRALDLWHNAYLAGLDAFIIVLDEPGMDWHCRIGFHSVGDTAPSYLERGYTLYWGDTESWFYVEPIVDCILTRAVLEDSWPEEVITVLSGSECLQLWSMGNSVLPWSVLVLRVTLHKVGRFLELK